MLDRLSDRDKRALKFGAIGAAVILVFIVFTGFSDKWADVRGSLRKSEEELGRMQYALADNSRYLPVVPVFESPLDEDSQKFRFRELLNEQIKKSGIKAGPLQDSVSKRANELGFKKVYLRCSGTCQFPQLVDLLVSLRGNPCLVGIEELDIKVDEKNRQSCEFDLMVSTFARTGPGL